MIDEARRLLAGAARVVSFSGAGLSAESGLSTFRDKTEGLWARYDPMTLASPEGFAADPTLVIDWYADRRRAVAAAEPNPAHRALAALPGAVHVTQNVDDLLHRAGARHVLQVHGTIAADRCHSRCGFYEEVDLADPPPLRQCPQCGGQVRPDVVWFGEGLPGDVWTQAQQRCVECDLLLVIGTSAVVYPAAGLIDLAKSQGARIIIVNTERSGASGLADVEVIGKAGEVVPRIIQSTG